MRLAKQQIAPTPPPVTPLAVELPKSGEKQASRVVANSDSRHVEATLSEIRSPRLKKVLQQTLGQYTKSLQNEADGLKVNLPQELTFDQYNELKLPETQEPADAGPLTAKHAGAGKKKRQSLKANTKTNS